MDKSIDDPPSVPEVARATALRLRLETRALVLQSLPGPMKDLAAIGRAFLQHTADFAKRVIKNFMQEKNGALWRAESL